VRYTRRPLSQHSDDVDSPTPRVVNKACLKSPAGSVSGMSANDRIRFISIDL